MKTYEFILRGTVRYAAEPTQKAIPGLPEFDATDAPVVETPTVKTTTLKGEIEALNIESALHEVYRRASFAFIDRPYYLYLKEVQNA